MTGSKKRVAPQSTSQERRAVKKTLRMPSTIGNNASKHFPKDFFHLKKGQQKREGTGTSVHCNRNELIDSQQQDLNALEPNSQASYQQTAQSAIRSTTGLKPDMFEKLHGMHVKKYS